MKNTNVTIRLDDELKAQAEELFSQLGMSLSTAINVFLRQAVREQGIPFSVSLRTESAHVLPEAAALPDMPAEDDDEPDYNPMAMSEEDIYGQFSNFSSFMSAMEGLK